MELTENIVGKAPDNSGVAKQEYFFPSLGVAGIIASSPEEAEQLARKQLEKDNQAEEAPKE